MWHMAGYYDESDDVERGYSMAGFLGHQHDCVHLDFAWRRKILEKYGIKYFKASELNGGRGEFARFRDDPAGDLNKLFSKREKDFFDQVKVDSIDVILEFDLLVGLGVNLVLPDYHCLYKEYERIGKTLAAPYFFCAQLLMMESGFIMHKVNSGSSASQQGVIRPVFDSQEEYGGRAKQMFDEFSAKNPISSSALLPPHYEDDQKYLVLQAADNLAYECRRLLITEDFDTHIPERMAMKRLKQCIYKIYKLNYKSLKAIIDAQTPDVIPLEAEIHNRHELLEALDKIENQANEARIRGRELRPQGAQSTERAAQRNKIRAARGENGEKKKETVG
jgi:hypothetical protein